MIQKGLKYRLYPSAEQERSLHRCFAVRCRSWNKLHEVTLRMIEESEDGKWTSKIHNAATREMRKMKHEEGNEWMKEVQANIGEYVSLRYKRTWSAFFRKLKSGEVSRLRARKIAKWKETGQKINQKVLDGVCRPQWETIKDEAQSFQIKGSDIKTLELGGKWGGVSFKGSGGNLKFRLHRPLEFDHISTVTVRRTSSGRFYISFSVEVDKDVAGQPNGNVKPILALDSNIAGFVTSEGEIFEHPRPYKKYQERLAFLQRRLSRREKGSARYEKTRRQIAKLHERNRHIRDDFLHKLSDYLTRHPGYEKIAIEKLDVKEMMARPIPVKGDKKAFLPNGATESTRLARLMADISQSRFVEMLEYKGKWNGKAIDKIDPKDCTNKTCSECGHVNEHIHFKMKAWTCSDCGKTHGKYINGAQNILNLSKRKKYED